MKVPNVASLAAILAVVLPALIMAISQEYPPEVYWWAALATGVLGALVKAIQVWRAGQGGGAPAGALGAPDGDLGAETPGRWRALLLQ